MTSYRKIYEQYYGKIPKDSDGRTYEVHHIDGNHSNNLPENLRVLTIQEHYDIHYSQGDWAACQAIAIRMNQSPGEFSELCKRAAKQRVANGFMPPVHKGVEHPFYDKVGPTTGYKWSEEQISKVTGDNHWTKTNSYPSGFKRDKEYIRRMKTKGKQVLNTKPVIIDLKLNAQYESDCLTHWCKANGINYRSFRNAVKNNRLFHERYTYRLNNGK